MYFGTDKFLKSPYPTVIPPLSLSFQAMLKNLGHLENFIHSDYILLIHLFVIKC